MLTDVRDSLRQLRKAPGFTATALITLALGIGATTAVFSLVEGVLLRPLAYRDAERLVRVGDHLGGSPNISLTAWEIAIYSKAAQAFSSLGGYITTNYEISGGAQPENVAAALSQALLMGARPLPFPATDIGKGLVQAP